GNAREPERVVAEVEREQRHEPHEGDEAPAFGVHAVDQALQRWPGTAPRPISRNEASDKEGCRRPEHCASEVEDRAPERAEQQTAGEPEESPGKKEDRAEREEHDVADRRPNAKVAYGALDARRVELVGIEREPDRSTSNDAKERES